MPLDKIPQIIHDSTESAGTETAVSHLLPSGMRIYLIKGICTSAPPCQEQTQSHSFKHSTDSSHGHGVKRSLLCENLADELFSPERGIY